MAPRVKAVREPVVTELLAEEIAHLLMRADRVEPDVVQALVDRLRSERDRSEEKQA
ncbi:MAG TPA: hypothetical protein VMG55_08870 [Stellaceae bacterium]|nr:hypothetical protein [Stellaceae bacterium]